MLSDYEPSPEEQAYQAGFSDGQKQAYREIYETADRLAGLLTQLQQLEKGSTHDGK